MEIIEIVVAIGTAILGIADAIESDDKLNMKGGRS